MLWKFGVDLEDNQQCFDYSAVLPRNNGNRNKYLYVLIPLNGPCSVFSSSLSFHSCDIWCPHLFLVFPKHFILSVLAKHHDSDQFGCSLKSQLTPDGEPQLLCETDKKPPNLKTYEPLKYCWQFYQRCFPDNRCSYLYFFFNICETAYHLELEEADCWWLMLLSFQSLWILIFFPTIASATYCTTPSCNLEGYKRGCRENWGFIF